MKREDMSPERLLLEGQILCLERDIQKVAVGDYMSASMASDVLQAAKAALATLDQLGYTYHGGALFKPPLRPASPVRTPDAGVTDAQCERIIDSLNEFAEGVDRHDFGLPSFAPHREHMMGIIRGALRAPV